MIYIYCSGGLILKTNCNWINKSEQILFLLYFFKSAHILIITTVYCRIDSYSPPLHLDELKYIDFKYNIL
jgi:hypothetical protein